MGRSTRPDCTKCGAIKLGGYVTDALCGPCTSEYRKRVRAIDREAKGLRPIGSGENPNCTKCGTKKEPGYTKGQKCSSCERKYRKELTKRRRIEKGMRPFGSGRKPECCRCNGPKENPTDGYCNACGAANERERRAFRKKSEPDFIINERKKVNDRYKNDPEFSLKKSVRSTTNKYIQAGYLVKNPCEVCGNKKVDAHHDDYTKPLDVRWLCRKHHNEHHRNEQNQEK